MACVYQPDGIDFGCVSQIVKRVIAGEVDVLTARMLLKQIDSGLATFGAPDVVVSLNPSAHSIETPAEVANELQSIVSQEVDGGQVTAASMLTVVALLWQLWKLIQPLIKD